MARVVAVFTFLLVAFAIAQAQDFFGSYDSFAPSPRDPRQNRGPVTFPVTSPGSETSGVRVGASGFGFVPPGGRGFGANPGFGPNAGFGQIAAGPNPGAGFQTQFPGGYSSFYWGSTYRKHCEATSAGLRQTSLSLNLAARKDTVSGSPSRAVPQETNAPAL
ncbi:Hypothetical protein NTJ_00954 [Nesidiocoris tenuis]|uniref:Uncharacterized protein n=1 Tax=Nesidiocoris tenuis TaxID=355587 RepID=A0ABN7A855_9HEMI|nr:Hypothetical protein NTJ_00954 [Nesidiocoris tenuis]